MEKLLQQYEAESCGTPTFWVKVPPDLRISGFSVRQTGVLRTLSKNHTWKTRYYTLTQDSLLSHTSMPPATAPFSLLRKRASVAWKRVEAFTEGAECPYRFGFRLVRDCNSCDFYVSTAAELEAWLDRLQEVSIMTDFENDYLIEKEVGRGNYATVFLGRQLLDGQCVAIKRLDKRELESSPRAVLSVVNEVNIMKKLKHKRILRLLGLYEDDERLYLILEYAGGGDLFHRILEKGHLSEAKCAVFLRELLSALAYMHKQGIVHRDLKPENILLMSKESDTDFKIADFGLASVIREGEELNVRCGSPGYVAPEILEKHSYGPKVDVFSAGIILYIL